MLVPMLLGYIVGAVGTYALLYKLAPVVSDDYATQTNASGVDGRVEVLELFPSNEVGDERKVA